MLLLPVLHLLYVSLVYSNSIVVMPQPMGPRGHVTSLFTKRFPVFCMNVWTAVVKLVVVVVHQVVFCRVHAASTYTASV